MSDQATTPDSLRADWLLGPESNAAGRLGLFRIIYVLFYLWVLNSYRPSVLHAMPMRIRQTVLINLWNHLPPPAYFYDLLTFVLVAALVFLIVGLQTRLVTGVVLVSGALLESYYVSLDFEHATVLLTALIPLFMFISNGWGDTYSLDALIRRRAGSPPIDPADTGPRYVLPIHALLVVLAVLFVTGAIHKLLPHSPWFTQDNVFGNLMASRRARMALDGMPLNPIAWVFLEYPLLDHFMRWYVVLFEGLFFLALFNRRLRALFLSNALIFHAVNAIWLGVSFTPVLIVYALFVDWHALIAAVARRMKDLSSALVSGMQAIPTYAMVAAVVVFALAMGVVWTQMRLAQQGITFGGVVNWHTIWYPVLPLSVLWLVRVVLELLGDAKRRVRRRPASAA